MAQAIPRIRDGTLTYQQDEAARTLAVGSPAWYAWLAAASRFAYVGAGGRFTARKERAGNGRGGWYWKAYRRQGGQLRKAYLGKAEELTLARLDTVATALAERARPPDAPLAALPGRDAPSGGAAIAATFVSLGGGPPGGAAHLAALHRDPLLRTKLAPPPARPGLVHRPRLLARLREGVRSKLVLLAAPPGFGKTTLLGAWRAEAAGQAPPVAWVSLDPGDNDPVRFWRYIAAALDTLRAGVGDPALALLQSPTPPPMETALTVLLNALTDLPHGGVLVLDDYHTIELPAIHQALAFLLDHLPPPLRLIIATRTDPPLPLARWRARGDLVELRAADLRFTLDEAAAFLHVGMGLPLSAAEVASLEERTEGWIAGLQLAALSLRHQADVPGFIAAFTGSHRFVVDYLVDEVLHRQPEAVRTFLLGTAILDRFCAPLCEAVLGTQHAQELLPQLERANLFLVPLDAERRWYRYHHLFADVLRHHLRRTQPDQGAALHRRAATWFAREGLLTEAIPHALAGDDVGQAGALIEQSVEALWERGEAVTLQRWLGALPTDVLSARPHLLLARAWTQFLLQPHDAEAIEVLLRDAETALAAAAVTVPPAPPPALAQGGARAAARGIVAAIRASVAAMRPDPARTIAYAREALGQLAGDSAFWTRISLVNLGIAHAARGDVAAAGAPLAEGRRLALAAGDTVLAIVAARQLAGVREVEGRLRAAADLYRQALDLASRQGGASLPHAASLHIGVGRLLYEQDDLAAAERHLTAALDQPTRPEERPLLRLHAYGGLTRIALARGDRDGAGALLRRAEQAARANGLAWAGPHVRAFAVRLWLLQGRVEQAGRWAEGLGPDIGDEIAFQREVVQATQARVLLALGRADEALSLLECLVATTMAAGRAGRLLEALILRALALEARGGVDAALAALAPALALAAPEGYVRSFLDEGAPLAALLRRIAARGHAPGYVAKLLAAFDTGAACPSSAPPRPAAQPLAEPLREREREVLRLIAAGLANREIAGRLFLAPSTVKWYINTLYGKLGVRSRTQAVARAREANLL